MLIPIIHICLRFVIDRGIVSSGGGELLKLSWYIPAIHTSLNNRVPFYKHCLIQF